MLLRLIQNTHTHTHDTPRCVLNAKHVYNIHHIQGHQYSVKYIYEDGNKNINLTRSKMFSEVNETQVQFCSNQCQYTATKIAEFSHSYGTTSVCVCVLYWRGVDWTEIDGFELKSVFFLLLIFF